MTGFISSSENTGIFRYPKIICDASIPKVANPSSSPYRPISLSLLWLFKKSATLRQIVTFFLQVFEPPVLQNLKYSIILAAYKIQQEGFLWQEIC